MITTLSYGPTFLPEILYANIALDIEAKELRDRLFAYQIPEHLTADVFIGSQVLVPFGNQHSIGGYVVSLTDRKPEEVSRIRSISEVIEAAPLFDDQYIDFLHWLAFTTCSSLADVIAASLPSFLAPRLKRKVRLTEEGKKLSRLSSYKIFNILAQKGQKDTPLSTLKHSYLKMTGLNQKEFYKELNFLKQENLLEVVTDSGNAPKTKTVSIVSAGKNQPASARQKEILEVINREGGSINLTELLKEAKTTRNTIKKNAYGRLGHHAR